MNDIRIELKDRRILNELDRDSNASFSEIAEKSLISKQVAEYRINKLISQKTIYSFFTLVDLGRLGYSLFRVHIKLKNVSELEYSKFVKNLFEDYPTFWVAFVSGSFDIIADIWAHHANEFDEVFNHILDRHKKI